MTRFKNISTNVRVYFRPFPLPDNGSKNPILSWVLKLNLVQQKFLNPNTHNGWIHWILHIVSTSPALWLKMLVSFKFGDYTKFDLVRKEPNWMEIDDPRPSGPFSHL